MKCCRFQSGVYLCIATNSVPPSVSKRVQLYVDFPPTLWITHQLVQSTALLLWAGLTCTGQVGAQVGGSASIECLTAAHPRSLNFWHDQLGNFINQRSVQCSPSSLVKSGLVKLTLYCIV